MTENAFNDFNINPLDLKSKKIDLLKQELDVNLQEQVIISKKINLIKDLFQKISTTNPQYSILVQQLEMNQIELDEFKYREDEIKSKIKSYS